MTRVKYGVSPWIDEVPRKQRPDYPRSHGSIATPVAIVGGGLTGCLTAYAFAAAGVKVTLLEADRVGQQGSGHGPGILAGEPTSSYRELEARHGRKAARAMFEASRRAVLDLAATVRRLELKAGIETCDAIRALASLTADERALRRDADLRREAGLDAVLIKAAAAARESKVDGVRGAVRLHDWGARQPIPALHRHRARRRGAGRRDLRAVGRSPGEGAAQGRRAPPRGRRRHGRNCHRLHRRADRPLSPAQAARPLHRSLRGPDRPVAGRGAEADCNGRSHHRHRDAASRHPLGRRDPAARGRRRPAAAAVAYPRDKCWSSAPGS